ncbi:hypothetical protein CXQ85_000055 [Candidozyma haemuli]|uniref:Uncharacterized protein n=1 Tax=Candidozyma haemuli TaxID=45357 RepID=A0A2V1ASM1_9ASCO|nr:hypothetical protein CXQ85_000055 [[Candida] haemuloni]PVH21090.1 hypothetical protein CXQ85_000055 [[Candida] haemuloni]
MGLADVQTKLIDSFLAELEQLKSTDVPINFNNTSQLDALLTYLENADVHNFCSVPSVNVLHIILTLACRCPQSSWTHSKVSSDDGIEVSSSYMKEINDKYDNALAKDSLQQRSVNILNRYVDIISSNKNKNTHQLFKNLQIAIQPICEASIHFSRPRSRQYSSRDESPVIETIQDSESDEENIEFVAETETDLTSKYRHLSLPTKNVISLSDIGSKTTGLGEATSLFQNMPHLSAQATPEPEEHSPGPKAKKLKVERSPLEYLKLFDDHLITNRLMHSKGYNIWDLLRWVFTCCDDSSQYQQFLFNSNNTALHGIWETYNSALSFMFRFLKEQLDYCVKESKRSFLGTLLTQLGRSQDCYERLVEVVFTGLGLRTREKPFPCFPRETSLIKNDLCTSSSQGIRTKAERSDNIQSMKLRAQITATFLLHETNRFNKLEFVTQLSDKLIQFEPDIVFAFLHSLSNVQFVAESILHKFVLMIYNKLIINIVGSEDVAYHLMGYSDSTMDKIEKLDQLFQSTDLYNGLVNDSTYKSMSEFQKVWDMAMGLCYEMVAFTVRSEVSQASELSEELLNKTIETLNTLNDHSEWRYKEFLRSKSSDVVADGDDINFILEPEEIEK